jgi:hypothetical protein
MLFETLAAILPESDEVERTWTAADLEARSHRILFERVAPGIRTWPARFSSWLDLLPSDLLRQKSERRAPDSGTSWVRTRRSGPWPPRRFLGRDRRRIADQLMVTALAWTLRRLSEVRTDAVRLAPGLDAEVDRQLDLAARLATFSLLSDAPTLRPTDHELRMLAREGYPWSAVAAVARELRRHETSPLTLAEELLIPDPEFRWRLFHLGVLGCVLVAAQSAGATVVATAPLFGSAKPAFQLTSQAGEVWDLWFEGESAWAAYGVESTYTELTAGLAGNRRPLSPDVLLIQPGKRAVSVECKYSYDVNYLRQGAREAMAYSVDIAGRLAMSVDSLLVVPSDAPMPIGSTTSGFGELSIRSAASVADLVAEIVSADS